MNDDKRPDGLQETVSEAARLLAAWDPEEEDSESGWPEMTTAMLTRSEDRIATFTFMLRVLRRSADVLDIEHDYKIERVEY